VVRVVLKHLLGELAGHGLDHVLGLTGLEQVGDDRVAQVVEPQAGQARRDDAFSAGKRLGVLRLRAAKAADNAGCTPGI
jgi:hypothetical protein